MTAKEFNEKYAPYLEKGHYGCDLHLEEAINYLDVEFQKFILYPKFKYYQIKSKFNWFCFYADAVSREEAENVELKLKQIYTDGRH